MWGEDIPVMDTRAETSRCGVVALVRGGGMSHLEKACVEERGEAVTVSATRSEAGDVMVAVDQQAEAAVNDLVAKPRVLVGTTFIGSSGSES